MPPTPEALARQQIDAQLVAAGWIILAVKTVNLSATDIQSVSGVEAVAKTHYDIGIQLSGKAPKHSHGN